MVAYHRTSLPVDAGMILHDYSFAKDDDADFDDMVRVVPAYSVLRNYAEK